MNFSLERVLNKSYEKKSKQELVKCTKKHKTNLFKFISQKYKIQKFLNVGIENLRFVFEDFVEP